MVLAVDRLGRGDATGALALLEGAFVANAKDNNNLGLQLLRIKLFGQTGDFNSVEVALKKLVELTPQEPGYRKLLINFYVEQRRIEDAEGEMRAFAAANPADSTATLDLIDFYTRSNGLQPQRGRSSMPVSALGGRFFPLQIALAEMDLAEGNLTDGKQSLENLVNMASRRKRTDGEDHTGSNVSGQRNFGRAETLANDILRRRSSQRRRPEASCVRPDRTCAA
jgi:hypothetical protein